MCFVSSQKHTQGESSVSQAAGPCFWCWDKPKMAHCPAVNEPVGAAGISELRPQAPRVQGIATLQASGPPAATRKPSSVT
jgi:hypothetical protein